MSHDVRSEISRVFTDSVATESMEFYVRSAHSRAALTPQNIHRMFFGAAVSLSRCMVDSWVARWNFGGKPVYLERRCKDTSNICPFPNFLAKKWLKSAFLWILGIKIVIFSNVCVLRSASPCWNGTRGNSREHLTGGGELPGRVDPNPIREQ